MNKTFIIALLVVSISCNSMLEKYAFAFKSNRSIMTVMAQIESTIKSGGPMDAITEILNQFEINIKDEQVAHAALFEKQSEECESEFAFRRQQVDEANDAIAAASNGLESCNGQKLRAETDLKMAEKQLTNTRQSLALLERKKIQWDYMYATFQGATKMALESFPEMYRILDEIANGGESFAQLTTHITKMVPHAAKIGVMKHMNPVLYALAQLTTATSIPNSDKAFFERIKGIIAGFEAQVRDAVAKNAEENAKMNHFYNTAKAHLQSEVERLVQLMADLEHEIHQLKTCIVVQSQNLNAARDKFNRNANLLKKAEDMCHAMEIQFINATEARGDELDLLAAIKVKVEERYAQISHGATERGEMSADELKEYDQLDYEHKSFE